VADPVDALAGFSLVPADELEFVSPEDDAAAAALGALDATDVALIEAAEPEPFGRTWVFDHPRRRMLRSGGAPVEVRGVDALRVWAEMALQVARNRFPIFPANYGFDRFDGAIGKVSPVEEVADFEERMREALTVHDRVTDVVDVVVSLDPREGVFLVERWAIVTDEGDRIEGGPLSVTRGSA
jgi:hypothetical protein